MPLSCRENILPRRPTTFSRGHETTHTGDGDVLAVGLMGGAPGLWPAPHAHTPWAIGVQDVSRYFGAKRALHRVSLTVRGGEVHALLGPNGAGKTTLLRILAGLTRPTIGSVRLMGHDVAAGNPLTHRLIGVVPAGDRSFYFRLSGQENLIFFARLHGLLQRDAVARSREVLGGVGLLDAAHLQVAKYSHGMQKRLSVARALLMDPPVLLVDEATHDLDPEGAGRVRELVRAAAGRGAAVIWATQRIDEIRGFADTVTLLYQGEARFTGTVPQLMAYSIPRTYLLRVRNGGLPVHTLAAALAQAIGSRGVITADAGGDPEHWVLSLADGVALGDAIVALAGAQFQVLACQEARSQIEEAFLRLTREDTI